jgi:hypothetical protein
VAALGVSLLASPSVSPAFGDEQPAAQDRPVSEKAEKPYDPLHRKDWKITPGPQPTGLDESSPVNDVIPVVADKIFEMGVDKGFARQRTDYGNRSIEVLWRGRPPADVQAYADSEPLGVTVKLTSGAKYSRTEAERIRTRVLNSPTATSLGITSTELNDDGSGVTFGVESRSRVAQEKLDELREVAEVPDVSVRHGVKAPELFSRQNDSAPWKGGARTRHPLADGTGMCTSGFAVLVGSDGRLITAGHCDDTGNAPMQDGAGQTISPGGASSAYLGEIDSLLVDPSASPSTTPSIFRGGYETSTTSTVKGWASNWPGDPVCSSGASTGEHCGTVYDDSDTVLINGYNVGVIQVSAPSGQIMGGQGDSGGPMFTKVTGGVQARGILLGPDLESGSSTTSCGTTDPAVGIIECSRWLNYVPISTILNTWVVNLEVG